MGKLLHSNSNGDFLSCARGSQQWPVPVCWRLKNEATTSRANSITIEARAILQNAILSIVDPRGNWEYGWKEICELVGIDPAQCPAPFRQRDLEREVFARCREEMHSRSGFRERVSKTKVERNQTSSDI